MQPIVKLNLTGESESTCQEQYFFLNEIIVIIVTAPILMAAGDALNSILVTLAPLRLALGLT